MGSAYGFAGELSGPKGWFLIVWSDDSPEFPAEWEGYPVVKRGIPVAF